MTATEERPVAADVATHSAEQPSEWQKKIAGDWHGRPSLFDAEGNHVGYERITRASTFEDGKTVYTMHATLDGSGPLRNRFQLGAHFAFDVIDSDENRVYMGPDFYGTGQPYGLFVDAHYYSPGWQADLRTWNQVLPDGRTQVYSSVLHDGWSVVGCFNGLYTLTHGELDADGQAGVDAWIASETERGPRPQVLPTKERGAWRGVMEVYDAASQAKLGDNQVTIEHEPTSLTRARQSVTWDGVVERRYTFDRFRNGATTTYDGPDVWGNARGYGRALFSSQHFAHGDVWKIKGREVLLDDARSLAVVWEHFRGDLLTHVIFGQLQWEGQV